MQEEVSHGPHPETIGPPAEPEGPLELDDEFLDVFLPDDEPDRLPEAGDFWIDHD